MDVLGIETRPNSWSVVHLKSSMFNVEIERFISFTGVTFDERIDELKTYVAEKGLKNVRIAVGLPRESSLSMVLNIPAPKAEAIEGILSYELEKHIPFDPGEVSHGFQVLKKEKKVFSILLAAAKKDIVNSIVSRFEEAGFSPASVATWHASLFNALYYSNNLSPEKNIAFIGLNKGNLTLDIFSDLVPVYSKSISIQAGGGPQEQCLGLLERELNHSLLSLAGPVSKRRLDEGIIISDNEPQADFLKELSKEMSMPVRAQGLKELGLPSTAATALGAALSVLGKGRMKINLAPISDAAKKKPLYLNNLILSGIVFLLALFAGSSYLIKDWAAIRGLESTLTEVRLKKDAVQRLIKTEGALAAKIEELEKIDGKNLPGPLDVLKELTTLLPRDTWLTGLDYRGDTVSIEGYSSRASSLIMKMGKSRFMTDFEFAGPVARASGGKERFRMNFKLKTFAEAAEGGQESK